jgi:hypothetical protein
VAFLQTIQSITSDLQNRDIVGTVILITVGPLCLSNPFLAASCGFAYFNATTTKISSACDSYKAGQIGEDEAKAKIALSIAPVEGSGGKLFDP